MQQSLNIPFTHEQVKSLIKGFTPSGNGPNRKQRRAYLQKINRRPVMAMVSHIQYRHGKSPIYHYKTINQQAN